MVRKSVKEKVQKGLPLTPKQKLQVLKDARGLLEDRYMPGNWSDFINGVEHFCLYGAIQKVCGFASPGSEGDEYVSSCSLTSTLYEQIPRSTRRGTWHSTTIRQKELRIKNFNDMLGEDPDENRRIAGEIAELELDIQDLKVSTLQLVNDCGSKKRILTIVDKAISDLETQICQ